FGAPERAGSSGSGGAAPAAGARPGPAVGTTTATPTPSCPPNWSVVPSSTVGLEGAELYGVDAASSSDVWAVGVFFSETHSTEMQGAKAEGTSPIRQKLIAPHRDQTTPSDRTDV